MLKSRSISNRDSTSSEDKINTSDELMEVDCDKFIADCREEARRMSEGRDKGSPSVQNKRVDYYEYPGDRMVREAENARVHMFSIPTGKNLNCQPMSGVGESSVSHAAIDEEYLVIGGHIDAALQQKIEFQYIDFSRLIPKDRITKVEDHRFELVIRGGNTYFAPVSDRDSTAISSFARWEQAFRIYSNILTKAYPNKATELIQYNHIIYTASLSFAWENIYLYNKEFRMHVSNFPQHSWSIILQQAWSMCLKDRIHVNTSNDDAKSGGFCKVKEPCKRYNKGKCTYGARCRYKH